MGEKKSRGYEHWMQCTWRPLCALVYLILCLWDFFLAPIIFAWIQYNVGGNTLIQWQPLTMIGGGLFHIAFGGILGVSAYSRGLEKRGHRNYPRYNDSYSDEEPKYNYQQPYEDEDRR